MQTLTSRAAVVRLTSHFNRDFDPTKSVTLAIKVEECPEELGDELRLWCHRHCSGRWKQMMRGAKGMIVMGFESLLDAAMFRASALNNCRALIAASHRRQRAYH